MQSRATRACPPYLTELIDGHGFVGVFVAALTLRASERGHRYHAELHAFAEQVERLLMMVLLVCFGAAIAEGFPRPQGSLRHPKRLTEVPE
jgi:hypothetical protein